jgi:hypothetical protein
MIKRPITVAKIAQIRMLPPQTVKLKIDSLRGEGIFPLKNKFMVFCKKYLLFVENMLQ